uniref:TIR domain-containing protein n=1 Tax=Anguilla anguilla TaxID=7936 RepID=A0A0E9U776_ANGAN
MLQNNSNQHDAFVVFDTRNVPVRDWVYNELVVNLEDRGMRRFSLCLEERDWGPWSCMHRESTQCCKQQ